MSFSITLLSTLSGPRVSLVIAGGPSSRHANLDFQPRGRLPTLASSLRHSSVNLWQPQILHPRLPTYLSAFRVLLRLSRPPRWVTIAPAPALFVSSTIERRFTSSTAVSVQEVRVSGGTLALVPA